jgi:spore coat protein U-like protein
MKSKQVMNFNRRVLSLALASTFAFGAAFGVNSYAAGTATSNIAVTASVTANCTISAGGLGFGAYDPVFTNASAALDATATLTLNCTSGSAPTITLGQGANANTGSSDITPLRRLKDGAATANYLNYALYSDTGRSTVWGADATNDVDYAGTGVNTSVTVYGRVTGGQNVPAGSYTDTVVATVNF